MPRPTPEDLVRAVILGDDRRRKAQGLPSTRAALSLGQPGPSTSRRLVEPHFNLIGRLIAGAMTFLPLQVRRSFVQWINCKMGGYAPPAQPHLATYVADAVERAEQVRKKTGHWPATLILTSHPETEGSHQWLRFEVVRQGLAIADALTDSHPKCLLAIDPYALDTVPGPAAGVYSGWMHGIYLAWDRQPSTQSWFQKNLLLSQTDYSRIAWRLLRELKAARPVLMVLGGGLPFNARLLYGAREFVQRLAIPRWNVSKREAQLELIKMVELSATRGTLAPETKSEVLSALIRWGLPENLAPGALHDFEEEFASPIPYRARLFKVLMKRLVGRGRPLLLVAVSHTQTAPYVRLAPPVAVTEVPDDIDTFSKGFVRANFYLVE